MRAAFLALAMIFAVGNNDLNTGQYEATDAAIQALVDEGQDAQGFAYADEAALRGDAKAHEWLGWFYDNGRGVEQDYKRAEHHYRIAANQGLNHSTWRLGVMIDTGLIDGELAEAVQLFERAAEGGFSRAMVSMAVMQATGRGTEQDFEASLANYMRAARAGNTHGCYGVAVLLINGEGLPADPHEAGAWFLVAAANGNTEAENGFGYVIQDLSPPEVNAIVERGQEIAEEFGFPFNVAFEQDSESPKGEDGKSS